MRARARGSKVLVERDGVERTVWMESDAKSREENDNDDVMAQALAPTEQELLAFAWVLR